ncbi:MAG TPA: pyridoxamine 5'-phosphate oxidase family protein [Polyangia bacterium]
MAEKLTDAEKRKHLHELIKEFDSAMLVTRTPAGELRARPLAIAEAQEDGLLYFATAIDSGKVHEVEFDSHVCVTLQDKRRFVSVSGRARVVTDRALIEELYKEDWKVWFPQGKDDPSLSLLVVDATAAEYWDNAGAKGLGYLFEAAAAYVKGTRPREDNAQNAKVRM